MAAPGPGLAGAGRIEPLSSSRNDAFALFPLQPDEATTCDAMLTQAGSRLLISPNHHINAFQVRAGLGVTWAGV